MIMIAEKLGIPAAALLPKSDANILYQPNMNDNTVGFVNNYNHLAEDIKLYESLLKSKDEVIQSKEETIQSLKEVVASQKRLIDSLKK